MKKIFIVLVILLSSINFAQDKQSYFLGTASIGFGSETGTIRGKEMKTHHFGFDLDYASNPLYSVGLKLMFQQSQEESIETQDYFYRYSTSNFGLYLSWKVYPFPKKSKFRYSSIGFMPGVDFAKKYNAASGQLPEETEKSYYVGNETMSSFSLAFPIALSYSLNKQVHLTLVAMGRHVEKSYNAEKFNWTLNFGIGFRID